ncbi:MAG: PilW family protein [Gallionella sp.]|nr:PilW family protein [Gallionella sp.]
MTPHTSFRQARHPHTPQGGFTLVEIMVGLAIGMLATMVIMQVLSVFEVQKRTTTGTADAQTNGSIALFNIGRELQVAGYPLMPVTDSPLECDPATTTLAGTLPAGITGIFPVAIADAADPSASDRVTIRYGNSLMGGVPTAISALTGSDVTVDNNFGCQNGDIAVIINGTTCAMTGVSGITDTTTIALDDATAPMTYVGANIACLGTWNEVTYAVNDGVLERNGVPSVDGIVNLQAQYGISAAANSNQVTEWVDATGGTWAAPSLANRNRIKALRVAVVARNPKMEPADVTAACSSTADPAPTGLCAWEGSASSPAPTLDLSDTDADWLRYRYRVFETVIPLRNMIWASKETL